MIFLIVVTAAVCHLLVDTLLKQAVSSVLCQGIESVFSVAFIACAIVSSVTVFRVIRRSKGSKSSKQCNNVDARHILCNRLHS